MRRDLTADDAANAVVGGSVLACGGGGWVRHGELMGDLATRIGQPVLVTADELPDDAIVATVTAIGAPASKDWEIRPLDYVRALERLMRAIDRPVAAVMTAQNGASTTLNGWIQSAVLGVVVLDAAGDIRAHPTGKLGAMKLGERKGYETVQVAYGGNRALHGTLEVVTRGTPVTTSNVLRDVCTRVGGFIASARHPVEASWVKANAALGAVSYALALGAAMRAAMPEGPEAVMAAVCSTTGGQLVGRGRLTLPKPVYTEGGWDRGAVVVGDLTVRFLNEFMTIDRGPTRVATFPDVIAILSEETGLPIAVEDFREGTPAAVLHVPRTKLILSSSTRDRLALEEVESIMGIEIVRHALDAG